MRLAEIEEQLLRHAHAETRRWQEIAQLLMRVEKEQLWQAQAASFTAWIQAMARRADLQQSVFWRCLKAGRTYLELTGRDELDASVTLSAESLELADKIQRVAPKPVAREVVERTLDGELSRTELREVWATYRAAAGGATARGRLPDEPQARAEAIAARSAAWEAEKRKPENRSDVRRGELLSGFRGASWLEGVDQARAETRLQGVAGRITAALVVRRITQQSRRLEVHGLWTCVSEPELADYDYASPPSADFLWLAVPAELAAKAHAKAPRMVGVLELCRDRSLRVVRTAQRRSIEAPARLELLSSLLERAYLWP